MNTALLEKIRIVLQQYLARVLEPLIYAKGNEGLTALCKVFVLALALAVPFTFAQAQSLSGIKVGDAPGVLEKLNLKPLAREERGAMKSVKFMLPNGNELSVTYNSRENRIIYIENDWSSKPAGTATDIPTFKFGITTLEDIRRVNGSNGFNWKSTVMQRIEDRMITFNAYKIKSKPNQVAVFVTALSIPEFKNNGSDPSEMAKFFKLDALILAEEDYLDEIWGEEKLYDKDSKPINWN
jgi:hypothetical protein